MEDTHPRLLVALILSYKRSTHVKKKESLTQGEKTSKKQKKNKI